MRMQSKHHEMNDVINIRSDTVYIGTFGFALRCHRSRKANSRCVLRVALMAAFGELSRGGPCMCNMENLQISEECKDEAIGRANIYANS